MEKYAVFITTTTHIPGDQRSIDHPGHGYGEHTVDHNEVIEFETKENLLIWIEHNSNRSYGKLSYRAFKCLPIKVTTKTIIEID